MSAEAEPSAFLERLKFIVNLTDPVFRGIYHGHKKHDDDMHAVLERAQNAGVKSMIITGTSLSESREAVRLAKEFGFFCTVGCHPIRSREFETFEGGPVAYLQELDDLIRENLEGRGRVVAIGECGLDYDRLQFSSMEAQKQFFRMQVGLAKKYRLPLFLHSRNAHADFVRILREQGFGTDGGRDLGGKGGVVHSFTGTKDEVVELDSMGFHFSVNGCGMKTSENVEALKAIPRDRLMLETDAPWCACTRTHASKVYLDSLPDDARAVYLPAAVRAERFTAGKAVKGRNEPCAVGAVAWAVAGALGTSVEEAGGRAWATTVGLFGIEETETEL
ncbi:Mg-dependent DNase [Exidia glandulosa HHB12029]|uniref:Mg-dependent DNase n=1 Tax=Exidia glandulosa HHB12029 TaxID=1314781 RepID=A0A165CUJ0_EXIGL|nr:Mg-dependent DNase [Exidia glandulosa HHB12029]